MRHSLMHNMRLLPSDQDLVQLTLDDIKSLQTKLQQELAKLANVISNHFCFKKLNSYFFYFLD